MKKKEELRKARRKMEEKGVSERVGREKDA